MRYNSIYIRLLFVFILGFMVWSCKKENKLIAEKPVVQNPYDSIDYGKNPETIPIDSTTFLGLHYYIFSTTCAVPACHDGSFEPDFRTVESAYSTLVLHAPLKNNLNNDFNYRVEPGNADLSWLVERITTDDAVLGRMPLYDDPLTSNQVTLIKDWINNGAKDIFGNSPLLPNSEPTFFGLLAYDTDTSGIRLDTSRDNIVSAIKLPANTQVQLWFGLYDEDDEGNFIPGSGFTYNKVKFSTELFDFSGAAEQNLQVELATEPFMGPIPFSPDPNQRGPYFHHITINTANYSKGQSNYMRVYIQDADHSTPTELPDDGSQFYLMTYFSFVVQ
jgi:hypothetical protein